MSTSLYLTVGILTLYVFGTDVHTSFMDNIALQVSLSSYIIRFTFIVVLICHIPYVFFSGKESVLICIDEIRRQSMSEALDITI